MVSLTNDAVLCSAGRAAESIDKEQWIVLLHVDRTSLSILLAVDKSVSGKRFENQSAVNVTSIQEKELINQYRSSDISDFMSYYLRYCLKEMFIKLGLMAALLFVNNNITGRCCYTNFYILS